MSFPFFFLMTHTLETRTHCHTSLGFCVFQSAGRVTVESTEAWPYCSAITVFVSWLCACVQCRNVCVCLCVCVVCARQGEGADLSQSDRCNDPTSGDLIWRGIADPVMLPSATCAPFKFPAAVSPDRRREISGEWGEVGVLGDTGLCFIISPFCFLVKTKWHFLSFYSNGNNAMINGRPIHDQMSLYIRHQTDAFCFQKPTYSLLADFTPHWTALIMWKQL